MAKGFEAMIFVVSTAIGRAENGVLDVAYGKPDGAGGIKFPGNKRKTSGLIPILVEINKIDLCNILNYALGNIKIGGGFFGKKLEKLQKKAKEISDILDGNFLDPSKVRNPAKMALLIGYLAELDQVLDQDIVTVFPKIQTFKNNLQSIVGTIIQFNAAAASYESIRVAQASGSTVPNFAGSQMSKSLADPELQAALANASRFPGSAPNLDLNSIPNAEVQKVMGVIRDIKSILNVIIAITSVGDIASRLIPNQIKELQKILNPAALLPMLRVILNLANGLNQIVQTILKILNVIKTIVKVLTVLLKVIRILIKITRLLPIPLMFAVYSMTAGLDLVLTNAELVVNDALKRLGQIGKLIDIFIGFATTVSEVLQEVIIQIEILIFTLESCAATNTDFTDGFGYDLPYGEYEGGEPRQLNDGLLGGTAGGGGTGTGGRSGNPNTVGDGLAGRVGGGRVGFGNEFGTGSPILIGLNRVKGKLMASLDLLNGLTKNYRDALANSNEMWYNGYLLRIEDEELADEEIRNKRRRAVAYDYAGVLADATDLTFATDKAILFEEIKLKLVNSGLVQDSGAVNPQLNQILGTLNLPETTDDIYKSIGIESIDGKTQEQMLEDETKVIKERLNKALDSIKGVSEIRKDLQATVSAESVQLREDIKNGKEIKPDPTTGGLSSKLDNLINSNTGDTKDPNILTDTEQKRLQGIVDSVKKSDNRIELTKTQTYRVAVKKLRLDLEARAKN